jgi:hypothetical protein
LEHHLLLSCGALRGLTRGPALVLWDQTRHLPVPVVPSTALKMEAHPHGVTAQARNESYRVFLI